MGGLWVFGVGVFIVAPVVLIVIFLLIKASSDASAARREVDTLGRYVTQLRDSMRDLGSKDEVAKLSEKVRALEAALGSSEPDDSRFAPPLVDAPLAEPASKPAVELSEVDPEPQPEPVADAPKPAARKPVSMPETSSARAAEKYRKQAAEEMRKALRPREPVAPPPVAPEPPPVVPPDPEPEPKPEPPPVVQPEPKPEPVRPAASVAREPEPARPPSTPAPRKRKARKAIDWEALIGGKLALWAGSGLVLIAAAFGLAYGWKFIQPEGRVALGVVLGLGMVGAAELARKRTESWYPEGLTGAGVGVLYLSIWAAAIRYGLFADILLPFGLMAVVTAICAGMSVRHDSRALILLATLGGFATPFLLKSSHGGPDYAIRFWAYVTCLNGGILAVSAFRRWREMNLISFVATLVLLVSWFIGKYNDGLLWTVLPFLSVNFVLFVGIGSLYALRLRKVADWADVSLVALATVAYSTTALYMLPGDPRWHRAALAFILAAFFAGLLIETVRRLPNDKSLLYCNLGMGLAFLTIGFPLLVGGHPLAMAWAAEAAVLVALGFASKRPELRGAGLGVWGLAACYTVWVDARVTLPYDLALINERGALYLVLAGSAAATAWLYLKLSEADDDERSTAGVMTLASGIALCALTAREILGAFSHEAWFPAFHPHWRSAAWLCIWAAWAAIISVVYGVGLRSRLQFVYEIAMTALLGTGLATVVLGGSSVMYDWPGLLNPRFIAALVVAAALGCSGTLKRWARGTIESGTEMALAAAAGVVAATGLAEEMWSIVAHGPLVGAIGWMPQAWFAAAMVAMACAVLYALIRLYGRAQAWHWTGSAVGGAAIVLMVCVSVLSFRAEWAPFLSLRTFTFVLAIVGAAGIGLLRHIHRERMGDGEREGMPVSSFAATTALLVGWWLTIEVTRAFGIHVPAGIDRNYGTWFTLTGMWVVLGLLTFSVGLGLRLAALRLWGCVFWALAMATGLCVSIPSSGVEWEPFANFRGLAFILLIICTAALAYVRHHAEDKMGERERTSLPTGGFAVLASVLVTWWLTIEVTRVFGVSMPDGLDRTYGTWFALTGMWVVLGLLTFLAGIPLRLPALRWCGCAFWGLAVATGLCVSAPSFGAEWTPFVSFRGLAFILLIACTAAIGFVRHHTGDKLSDGERSFMATSGFAVVVSVLVTCWLSIEVCRIFDVASPVGTDLALPTWLGLGAMWAVLGITSVGIGMAWRMRPLRYLGFAIGAGAVGTALVAGSLSHNELWIPFINWRMLAAMLGLGGIVLAAWMYLNEDSDATEDERHVLTPTVFAVTGMVLAVWASTVEARSMVHWNGGDSGTDWQLTGWCVVAAVWAVASAAGMALGLRWRLEALRWTASMTWICGAALALAVSMPSAKAAWLPFLNARALAMALVVGTVALIAWMVHRYRDDLSASEQSLANPGYFSVSGALLALFALTLETFHFFRHTQWPSASNWHHAGHVAISVVWSLYAAGWLAAGVSARQATSRWLSLCLFGLALAKLFAYDLRLLKLGSLHRMISFGVLGLILLGVAFLYGRFGAYIRGDAEDDPDEDTDDEA